MERHASAETMNVLGFSGIANGDFYERAYGLRFVGHDAAVAVIRDGEVVFAIEEERLSRRKHTSALPVEGVRLALSASGLRAADVHAVAYPWNATAGRIAHMFLHHPLRIPVHHWPTLGATGARVLRDLMSPSRAVRNLEAALGERFVNARLHGVPHHRSHAACAFFSSPFPEAAVLTVDGQGEDESASLGCFSGSHYRVLDVTYSPDSIGLLYAMITDFLGLRSAWDEYKVMGMAAQGDPTRFASGFDRLVKLLPRGRYRTLRTAMIFKPGYVDSFLAAELGIPKRDSRSALEQVHFDVAAGLQAKTEVVLFHLLHRLRDLTSTENLCLAGGVFQNSVANGKILKSGVFKNVHVPSVPGDHGGALGAAFWAAREDSRVSSRRSRLGAFLGPAFGTAEVELALREACVTTASRPVDIARDVAELIAEGRVVGWFQGRAEYGPRALGHRSILADSRPAKMKDIVNERIKHREAYRPFAGAVPLERAPEFFELEGPSPFMQFVVPIRDGQAQRLAAISHDGTCRVQTVEQNEDPLFHRLLTCFGERTGVPVVLNTSFNDADEPIVCSPADAVRTFRNTGLDAMALGPFLVKRA